MKQLQKGFTLIELMIVVAIIGILLAVALPAYKDHTIREKVTELLRAADGFKGAVAEKAQADGKIDNAGAGLTVTPSGKVTGGSVASNGVISISGSTAPTSVGADVTIVLTPTYVAEGKLIWNCTTTPSASFKYAPAECRK